MKWIRRISVGVLALFLLWLPVAWALTNFLVVEMSLEKADAILVLSGSAAYRERTEEAARLYHLGMAPKILLTDDGVKGGWNESLQRNPYFVERAKWALEESGVPSEVIEILPRTPGDGTNWEAEHVAETMTDRRLQSLMIVTSAYHSRRSLWTFKAIFRKHGLITELGVRSPPNSVHEPSSFTWWFYRNGWKIVVTEYSKFVIYQFQL